MDPDIVTVDAGSNSKNDSFTVARNVGGAFNSVYSVSCRNNIQHMDHGDFDGDDYQDIVVHRIKIASSDYDNDNRDHILFYRNNNSDDFELQKEIVLDDSRYIDVSRIMVADYDNDSDPDILYWSRDKNIIGWLENTGDWNFSAGSIDLEGSYDIDPDEVFFFDLTGEGYWEIMAVGDYRNDYVMALFGYDVLNRTFILLDRTPVDDFGGTWVEIVDVLVHDINGDGYPDMIIVAHVSASQTIMTTFLSGPNPSGLPVQSEFSLYETAAILVPEDIEEAHWLEVLDIEVDGDMDIVSVNRENGIVQYFIQRSPYFPEKLMVYGGEMDENKPSLLNVGGYLKKEVEIDFINSSRTYFDQRLPVGPVTEFPLNLSCSNADGTVTVSDLHVTYRLPDVIITNLSFDRAVEGGDLRMDITVSNGGIPVTDVNIVFYDNGDRIAEVLIPEIPSGGTVNETAEWDIPFFSGAGERHEISVVIDPDGMIVESNESNNRASGWVYVRTSTATRGTIYTVLQGFVFFAALWTVSEYAGYIDRRDYNLAGNSIWRAEEAIKFAKKHGIEPPPGVRMFYRQAKMALKGHDFDQAAKWVEELKYTLRGAMMTTLPMIEVDTSSLKDMKAGRWNHREILVSNIGNTNASEVEIIFHSGMPVKGRLHRMRMHRGKKTRILVGFMPFRRGEFNVDVDIAYKRAFDGATFYKRINEMVIVED